MKFTPLSESRTPYLKINEDVRFSFLETKDYKTILKIFILTPNAQILNDIDCFSCSLKDFIRKALDR